MHTCNNVLNVDWDRVRDVYYVVLYLPSDLGLISQMRPVRDHAQLENSDLRESSWEKSVHPRSHYFYDNQDMGHSPFRFFSFLFFFFFAYVSVSQVGHLGETTGQSLASTGNWV